MAKLEKKCLNKNIVWIIELRRRQDREIGSENGQEPMDSGQQNQD